MSLNDPSPIQSLCEIDRLTKEAGREIHRLAGGLTDSLLRELILSELDVMCNDVNALCEGHGAHLTGLAAA